MEAVSHMNYAELLKMSAPDGKPKLITCATTGVHDHDQLICVCVGGIGGNTAVMAVKGVPEEAIEASIEYHGITPSIYKQMVQFDPAVFIRSVLNWAENEMLVTYNPSFMSKMLNRMAGRDRHNALSFPMVDVAGLHQWITSGQIFCDDIGPSMSEVMAYIGSYRSRFKSIHKILEETCPYWKVDPVKIVPESMVNGLRQYCLWLTSQDVRTATPVQVSL